MLGCSRAGHRPSARPGWCTLLQVQALAPTPRWRALSCKVGRFCAKSRTIVILWVLYPFIPAWMHPREVEAGVQSIRGRSAALQVFERVDCCTRAGNLDRVAGAGPQRRGQRLQQHGREHIAQGLHMDALEPWTKSLYTRIKACGNQVGPTGSMPHKGWLATSYDNTSTPAVGNMAAVLYRGNSLMRKWCTPLGP